MKKLLLLTMASLMTVFAMAMGDNSGSTKANAIDFDWDTGAIHESTTPLWYRVKLDKLYEEDNPALGFRAIRICLTRPEIFRTQLRALYRASAFGELGIMFPMIISVREVIDAKEVLEECRKELTAEGVNVGDVEIGIMIETPAAVMIAEQLAAEVDFFSIGTNDLTQYTLAIDRQNPRLDPFYDSHHPAVLKMIEMTVTAAHKHDCWVGICGELGADTSLTETFLKMGIDELSVNPGSVLSVRKTIRSINLNK